MMAARFEGDVCGCAASQVSGLTERDDLRVVALVVEMRAFADDLAIADKYAPNLGVGRGQPNGRTRHIERTAHESLIELVLNVRSRSIPTQI
jgi:hypothetical protein